MIIRAMGILALTLAAGCALEQGDDPVVGAPGTQATTGGGASPGAGAQTPTTGQSNQVPLAGDNGKKTLPSTQADPCDPDPQPWKPACPFGPGGAALKRDPVLMTPPAN